MKIRKLLITGLTALAIFSQALMISPVGVYADETDGVMGEEPPVAEEEFSEEEFSEDEYTEGGEESSSNGVVVSSIQADNGLYIASSFPEYEMPSGFNSTTANYQGEDIMLAQMTTKSTSIGTEGMKVTLAYLTDEDGSNGEFYLCDVTENARMSDMIKIDGAEGRYIIVLDPGDNITGPDGFVKHNLSWGSKSAVAWSLPSYNIDEDEKEDKDEDEDADEEDSDAKISLFSVKVYADDLFSAGAGSGEDEEPSEDSEDTDEEAAAAAQEAAEKAMSDYIEESNIAHTNASGLIEAQPEDFCLLYAVDEEGNVGFYLYDIDQKIYQRYVDIPKGEGAALTKYRKQSRIRLIIIIALAVILLIMLFILINQMTKSRDGYSGDRYRDDDDDDDISELKARMDRNRRRPVSRRDEYEGGYDDEDDEDVDDEEDDEDDEDYFGSLRDERTLRGSRGTVQQRRSAQGSMQQQRSAYERAGRATARTPVRSGSRSTSAPVSRAVPDDGESRQVRRRPQGSGADDGMQSRRAARGTETAARRRNPRDDFDDDFEFEYLKFNK